MDYKISHTKTDGFVRIKIYKTITADLERSFAKEAIEIARRNDLLNYYADVRGVPNVATTVEQYNLAYQEMAQFGLDYNSKIAVVHEQEDRSHDFIETVFLNAGYSCKLFIDESEAYDWLKS